MAWGRCSATPLSTAARRALAAGVHERVGLAAISLKEAAWFARGRVRVTEPGVSWSSWLREAASAASLEMLPLTVEVAIESEQFPQGFPSDPADRLIAATARVYDLTLVTADTALRGHGGVRTLW